jgi:hypothetical protein
VQVTFTRTGERRYSIVADRGGGSVLHMPRGPGYDPWLPHDLVHFVPERHLGIARGVFGQLAAGGTAGTFFTGEALPLTWPADLTFRPAGSVRGRRPSRDRGVAVRRR